MRTSRAWSGDDPPSLPRSPGRRFELLRFELLELVELVADLRDDPPRYDLVTLGFNRGTCGLVPTMVPTGSRDCETLGTAETRRVHDGCETSEASEVQGLGSSSTEG